MRLLRIPGVYGPGRDSELLANAIRDEVEPGERVLDVFTGSGVQAIAAARAGAAEVVAIDVARRAVAGVRLNARLNGAEVEARRGDMFEPVADLRFDLIVANPPFVPSDGAEGPVHGAARAWEAGHDGRRLLDPFLEAAPDHLRPGGRILVVHSSLCDESRTLDALAAAGLDAEILIAETAPLGPITAPRADALERRGLLDPGERVETTFVIRAVSPAIVSLAPEAEMPALSTAA